MKKHTITIDADVRAVLERSTMTDVSLALPSQLDSRLYQRVNKVLVAAGGKWNRATGAHVFTSDPRQTLGLALAEGGIVDTKKARQQFFAPEALADEIVDIAELRPEMAILEPSAGAGALADAMRRRGCWAVCVDIDTLLVDKLLDAGYSAQCADFLTVTPIPVFDRVVMNPPFERGQEVDHVLHALKFLKPGGRLVSIMSASVGYCTSGKYWRLQAVLDTMRSTVVDLPGGAFRESGTSVRTVLVTIYT